MNTRENLLATHREILKQCIERITDPNHLAELDKTFTALSNILWERSARTLSGPTLTAIFERALQIAKEKYSLLDSFSISEGHQGFSEAVAPELRTELVEAFRYYITTVLTLIGNLTADVLLTGLYDEISKFLRTNAGEKLVETKRPARGEAESSNMRTPEVISRIQTRVSNLDDILGGGLPKNSVTVLSGPPGTGKTILSQQVGFSHASVDQPTIFFQTLSEPTAKTIKYLSLFSFFDQNKVDDGSVTFIDLGGELEGKGAVETVSLIMRHVKRIRPSIVVIDSFKVFEDMSHSREELRKISYELTIQLMAWECTTLLLGEFVESDLETNPVFSIIDGLIRMKTRYVSGEVQRFIQVVKMRGTDHSRDEHSLAIEDDGVGIYAPRVTIRREPEGVMNKGPTKRAKLGISRIDELLGQGVPVGSSFILAGVAGTGKTLISLEFIYRGAKEYGEKGIYFSFEETEDRLRASARSMGWELDSLIESGMVKIVFISQPEIVLEKHLLMMSDEITKLGAKRIAVDSVSIFVHKVTDPQIVREKIFQLATLVQKVQGVGLFANDIPYGTEKLSRFGVEETVVDGVILLTSTQKEFVRERFIEIYKLRNTAHANGRHVLEITPEGVNIIPRIPQVISKAAA